jgi:hypothetical protein
LPPLFATTTPDEEPTVEVQAPEPIAFDCEIGITELSIENNAMKNTRYLLVNILNEFYYYGYGVKK